MVARFLITTADERSWRTDRPVLFLGEWCRLYERRASWETLDAELVAYHWDDREQLYQDYLYLRKLYEVLLAELSEALNAFHGVQHSTRYWRILVGPWLGFFTQMLFDRWTMIQRAVRDHEIEGYIALDLPLEQTIPNDMTDFVGKYVGDLWNHAIYSRILSGWSHVPCERVPVREAAEPIPAHPPATSVSRKRGLYSRGLRRLRLISEALGRSTDAFLISSHLPLKQDFRLQLALGQLPKLWRSPPVPRVKPDIQVRQKLHLPRTGCNGFEDCVRRLIPEQIPILYLEGYRTLQKVGENLPWPKKPWLIFTSNSYDSDDIFKSWAGAKIENGSLLVIGQHGGHYGVGRWSFEEDHEIAICDSYLSWGWTEKGQPKVKPVGMLKSKRPLGVQHKKQPSALLVTCVLPRQSYWMYSIVVARQWLDYFADQCAFVEHLPQAIQDALTVRLFSQDYGWDQALRWRERFPDLHLDGGRSDIDDLIRQSRLYIATYNATTFLESFTMNVPTVIFWNPKHWELRDSAIPYFDDLKRVGIFHETPESAARHVAAIWDDVDAWWTSPAVREVLVHFKKRYCHLPDDLLGQVESALRKVMTDSSRSAKQ